eukprot:TRINITY_DN3078_c0_g2_i1.p1 TRINITY_DN3078_c0_g2~~TRINITY_DN3078_c0_g2_i1.p1  ORF type:complete len:136 (-),score=33.01 TRINITY_DN3078_c0_g2_i1:169-537(-)
MRPLTEEETKVFFEKLAKYIGRNIKYLIDRKDGEYCFRLHNDRVFYVKEELVGKASNVSTKEIKSLGTCFGKFSKSKKFKLHITALDAIAPYAAYKVGCCRMGLDEVDEIGRDCKTWMSGRT